MEAPAASVAAGQEIFVAALNGDIAALKPHVPSDVNKATPEGYTPLSLATSAQHVQVVCLLLREGANVDSQDQAGITALMHACMHGNASLVHLLLLHGANPLLQNGAGENGASLAARYGRPAGLGVLFRANAALVEASDGRGRTPMHWAVCSRHAPTVKYLIGRWSARLDAIDAECNTPLHLVGTQQDVLLLLCHGTEQGPSLEVRNSAGQTAAEAATSAGALLTADLLNGTARWAVGDRRLFSFLTGSPMRRAPAKIPPPPWMVSASLSHALVAVAPVLPPTALDLGWSFGTALSAGLAAPVAAALVSWLRDCWGCRGASTDASPATGMAHTNAALLVGAVAAAGLLHCTTVVPIAASAGGSICVPAYGTVLALGGYWAAYGRLQALDPGFLPSAGREHATKYWDALEKLPPGVVTPEGVCERSELFLPPRAAYSKISGGAVRAMDHDCPWVGRTIGANTHPAFLGMLLFGFVAVALSETAIWQAQPTPPLESWTHALYMDLPSCVDDASDASCEKASTAILHGRKVAMLVPLLVLLQFMLTPLLIAHTWLAAANVTTREHMRWVTRAQTTKGVPPLPMPWGKHWHEYAPYSRGLVPNLRAFARGARDRMPGMRDSAGEGSTWGSMGLGSSEPQPVARARIAPSDGELHNDSDDHGNESGSDDTPKASLVRSKTCHV